LIIVAESVADALVDGVVQAVDAVSVDLSRTATPWPARRATAEDRYRGDYDHGDRGSGDRKQT